MRQGWQDVNVLSESKSHEIRDYLMYQLGVDLAGEVDHDVDLDPSPFRVPDVLVDLN